jgi:aspartate/methionine/tyrosine aminotransferase
MEFAERIKPLAGNIFALMDQAKADARALGKEIIDLSLGSSDLAAPPEVIQAIASSLQDTSTHGYVLYHGTQNFRKAAANWYSQRFGVAVDAETEVLPLIGCQEGTAHLPLAILNPGDFALLQDPGYPSHYGGIYLAGGQVYPMPLLAENNFLPIFEDIPQEVLNQTKMMVLSYPHNPTTAIAPLSFFEQAVDFCRHHGIVLVHDFPYVDIVFDEQITAPSVFQADSKKELAIEFFTFSKSYNMGGFRVAYAIGNSQIIRALRQVKAVIDFNQYRGILNGAIAALNSSQESVHQTVAIFKQRRDVLVQALQDIGWEVPKPQATLYIWAKLPEKWSKDSLEFCLQLVKATGVATSPGSGFGKSGEGYVRFALVHPPQILTTAVERIAQFLLS